MANHRLSCLSPMSSSFRENICSQLWWLKKKFLICTDSIFFLFVVGYQKWDIASSFGTESLNHCAGLPKQTLLTWKECDRG